jgi:hypothetical protein
MAFNGSGTFNRIYNWVNDKANGFKITASRMDGEFDGIATGLSQCITKDGQTTITANIPLNNYKLTGAGNGTARTDVINVGQVQDNQFQYLGTTGGTADAYTLTPSPSIDAYATTQQITAKISATNLTTTPYLQISGIANPATTAVIKKLSATKTEIAVEASDLLINGIYDFQRNSANDAWIILNPEKAFYNGANLSNLPAATTAIKGVSYLSNPITIANNATTPNSKIDFLAGVMTFDDGSGQINTSAMTGDLANAFGTSDGMLDTGTKANTSDYSLFTIYNPTTGIIKPLASLSRTAPTMPSGFTKKDYRGKILTDASGNILRFKQYKDQFEITGTYPFKPFPSNTTTFTDISFATNYAKDVEQMLNMRLFGTLANGIVSIFYAKSIGYDDITAFSSGETNSTSVGNRVYGSFNIQANSSGAWQYRVFQSNSYVVDSINYGFYLRGWKDYNLKI